MGFLRWLQKGLDIGPPNEESKLSTTARFAILYQRGVDFLENDRFEEAQEAFSSAIMSSPQEPETWFLRAVAFDRLERYDQALFDCNRALTLRPRTHNYLWVRARLFLALGRYEESLSDADQAFKLQPGEFDHYTLDQFYSFAATAAMILVDDLRQEALEFLKRAIDCDPVKYRELASQEQDFDLLGEDPEYGTRFQELVANPQVRPEDELTPDNTADPIPGTDAQATDFQNNGAPGPAIPDLPARLESSNGADFDAATTLYRDAVDLVRMERYDEALIRFERIVKLFVGREALSLHKGDITQVGVLRDPVLRSLLADTLNQMGLASARQEGRTLAPWSPQLADFAFARRLRPDEPDDPDILVLQGTSMRSFYPKKALATITRASELRPEDPGILYERVLIRLDLGHHKKASEDIARILELNPDHVKSLCFRGSQYLEQGLSYEALEDFDHALEIEPDSPHALYGHAVALVSDFPIPLVLTPAVNDFMSGALLELDRAKELVNHFEKPLGYDLFYWWRSQALLRLRRFEEALDDCENYIAENPEDPDGPTTLDNIKKLEENSQYTVEPHVPVLEPSALFRCWYDTDEFARFHSMVPMEDRLTFFNRELEKEHLFWAESALLANRGDTLLWTGSHEDALSDFSRALELAPEDAYIHALRGKALEILNRFDEALIEFDRALDLQPGNFNLLRARSNVRDQLGMEPD